jgi:hypothetical protein
MHIRGIAVVASLVFAVAAVPSLMVSPADAADQIILGKLLLVKDPQPGIDATKRGITVFGKEFSSLDTIVGDPLANGAAVEVIANGTAPSSQMFNMPAGAFFPGGWGWKTLGNPVFGYLYKDPMGVNGPVKLAFIKKTATNIFMVKVLIKGNLGAINVLPPASGTDGGMIFSITGGDNYCVNFGDPDGANNAGGLVKNAPAMGIANKLFKVVSTATAPTVESGCPVLFMPPLGGVELKGALPSSDGSFNYMGIGLTGANAACNSFFAGTHACELSELTIAEGAGDLVGLLDTNAIPVTSFWGIDSTADRLTTQCHDDVAFPCPMGVCPANHTWEYGTGHTPSRGQRIALDNAMGMLLGITGGLQCNSNASWVGCCI